MVRIRDILLAPAALLLAAGCIERTVTIRTEPAEARVYLNDQEVGLSPVTVPFTWYGDYDIVVRKPGYETLRTHRRLHAPWYQWPGIDVICECLVPFTVRDHHEMPILTLRPLEPATAEELLDRAGALRAQAAGP